MDIVGAITIAQDQARTCALTTDDYAAAERDLQLEYERVGRVARREGEEAATRCTSAGEAALERLARGAACERVFRAHRIRSAYPSLTADLAAPQRVIDLRAADLAAPHLMPNDDVPTIVMTDECTYCDYMRDVVCMMEADGWVVDYWFGANSRSHTAGQGGYYRTGREMLAAGAVRAAI